MLGRELLAGRDDGDRIAAGHDLGDSLEDVENGGGDRDGLAVRSEELALGRATPRRVGNAVEQLKERLDLCPLLRRSRDPGYTRGSSDGPTLWCIEDTRAWVASFSAPRERRTGCR